MNKTCENCGNPFEAQRETAKYCSHKCQVSYLRKASKGDVSITEQPEDVTLSVTLNKKDAVIRKRLIELFLEEGKTQTEVDKIMFHQDNYHDRQGYYFVPVRFTSLI